MGRCGYRPGDAPSPCRRRRSRPCTRRRDIRLRDRAARRHAAPRPGRQRARGAGARDRATGHARRALRRRAGRARARRQGREDPAAALPRRPVADRLGRRAGPARPRLRARLRDEQAVRRRLHRPQRRHQGRPLPLERRQGAARRARPSCSSSTSRTRTTTAAWSPTARTASSTSAWATAARAAIPRTGRRTRTPCSGRSSASTRLTRRRSR